MSIVVINGESKASFAKVFLSHKSCALKVLVEKMSQKSKRERTPQLQMSTAVGEQKIYNVFSATLYHKPGALL